MVFHHIFLGKTGAKQGEILADPPFERFFTQVTPLITFDGFRDPPPHLPHPCLYFPSKLEWSPTYFHFLLPGIIIKSTLLHAPDKTPDIQSKLSQYKLRTKIFSTATVLRCYAEYQRFFLACDEGLRTSPKAEDTRGALFKT